MEKARRKLPAMFENLDDFMYLHLKTKSGRFIHKWIIRTTQKLDYWVPVFEIGYYCLARKK